MDERFKRLNSEGKEGEQVVLSDDQWMDRKFTRITAHTHTNKNNRSVLSFHIPTHLNQNSSSSHVMMRRREEGPVLTVRVEKVERHLAHITRTNESCGGELRH